MAQCQAEGNRIMEMELRLKASMQEEVQRQVDTMRRQLTSTRASPPPTRISPLFTIRNSVGMVLVDDEEANAPT